MRSILEKIMELLKKRPVRYLISSGTAFVINYVILLGLEFILRNFSGLSMELAAVPAFITSSQVNFWINRRWVFRSQKAVLPELAGYYSLAIFSFSVKTYVLLEIAVRLIKLPLPIASPLSEMIMFAVNYIIQKTVIFNKKRR